MVVIVVALTFFPALALGPLAEACMIVTRTTAAPGNAQPAEPTAPAADRRRARRACSTPQLVKALPDALRKLDPRTMWRNPVMFVVEVGAVLTTVLSVMDPSVFAWAITVWLWLTVVFANLAEAVAEGRGKAQADTLRPTRTQTVARRLPTGRLR